MHIQRLAGAHQAALVIQAAGRHFEISLANDLPLRVIQPLYRQTHVIAAQGAGLVIQSATCLKRQAVPRQQIAPGIIHRAINMEREPRLGFYRAALVIEAAGVEAKSCVAAHRATAIVEQATHSPVLRRFPQRHQATALID
ncbi:Uncharacterised protein [Serratia marcescens]|nr:Uncharacterised protein [Serratia marcescens]CVD28224.1 Uncharacterised protein [Serratia marcescens]CVE81445.1 Uncharacterised protein [Serratia marcescens]